MLNEIFFIHENNKFSLIEKDLIIFFNRIALTIKLLYNLKNFKPCIRYFQKYKNLKTYILNRQPMHYYLSQLKQIPNFFQTILI